MKLVACTLGFCNWQTLAHSWSRLYPRFMQGWKHYFVDNHYPLNRDHNINRIVADCINRSVHYIDVGRDWGAAKNFNRAMPAMSIDHDTFVVGIDPDAYLVGPEDTLTRAVALLQAQPHLAWVCFELPCTRHNIEHGPIRRGQMKTCPTTGLTFYEPRPDTLDMMDATVWRGSFLLATGGLVQQYAYYGQVESPMAYRARKMGMNYAYLMDHHSACCREFADPEYVAWKAAHISGFQGSFAEWLTESKAVA